MVLYEIIPTAMRGSGTYFKGRAGETLGRAKLVYKASDGRWNLADADAVATLPTLGITLDSARIAGQIVRVLKEGYIGQATWTWTTGGRVYASTVAGELTQTPPGGVDDTIQRVGVASRTNMITFDPQGAGGTGCAILEGSTAYVGFDECKAEYANYFLVDGVADDVQMNLATAYVATLGGGSVELERGAFNNVATVNVPLDVYFFGQGFDTVINYDAGGNCLTITGDNSKIRDLRIIIVAGAGGAGTRPNGILADTRTNLEITNVWLYGDRTVGDDGSDVRQMGVLFSTVTYSKIALCRSDNQMRYGINLFSTSEYNTVTGNTCNGNARGIRLEDSDNNSVIGNSCHENAHGIDSNSSSSNTIVGNTSNENSERGIFLDAPSTNNLVTGNTCNENDRMGIELLGADNNTVVGNLCSNNVRHGILVSFGDNNAVTGNICYQNVQHGILNSSGNDNTLSGNTCNENDVNNTTTFDGIAVSGGDGNLVTGNTCKNNDRYGISVDADGDNNQIQNNYTNGNTTDGVGILNANCNNNIVTGNCIDEGDITDNGTTSVVFLNYDPSANGFITTVNSPAVVGGGGGVLP